MSGSIIAISSHDLDFRFAQSIASSLGLELSAYKDIQSAERALGQCSFEALLFSVAQRDDLDGLEVFLDQDVDINKIHFIVPNISSFGFEEIARCRLAASFVFRNFGRGDNAPEEAGRHYSRIVAASASQVLANLESLLNKGTKFTRRSIRESLQKRFIAEALASQLEKNSWNSMISGIVANAVDELIMNAIFDAPLAANGSQLYKNVARSTSMSLKPDREVAIGYGFDGDYLGVSVVDHCGSLDREKVLSYLAKNFCQKTQITRSNEEQGAGLGLSLILRNGGSLRFGCVPQEKTEVTLFVKKTESFNEFRRQFRFVSTYIEKS